jgi:hypothetical protein
VITRAGAVAEIERVVKDSGAAYLTDVATNASGRAVVVYVANATAPDPYPYEARVRTATGAGWGAPVPLGSIANPSPTSSLFARAAVHSSGVVCAAFSTATTGTSTTVTSRCGTPASLGSAAPQTVGQFATGIVTEILGSFASLAATASGFAVAGTVASTGTVPYPDASPPAPTRIRVRERPAASGAWATTATLGFAGEWNGRPTVLAGATGSVVHFVRIRGAVGSDPGSAGYGIDQRVAQRQGSGAWSAARTASTLSADTSAIQSVLTSTAAVGPAGELLVSAPTVTAAAPYWTSGFVRRSSWSGAASTTGGVGAATYLTAAIAASGRATVVGRLATGSDGVVAQSALPKPFVRQAARITAVPRVGVASACGVAFTDAASIARQWRVNGVVRSTASKYTPTAVDRGKTLVCRVTATNPTGTTVSASPGRTVA